MSVQKHFVTFYSPGTIVAETTTMPIDSWDADKAAEMAESITERHGAKPYGFRFMTRARSEEELDSKVIAKSNMYYINCEVHTLEEIKARRDPADRILIDNMECNRWDRIVTTTKGWGWAQPLEEGDVVLS